MSGGSAASAPGQPGTRAERPVGRKSSGSRWERLLEGGLLQGGVQGSPVLRLFMRWVRRPLLPVMRLWRRNIQLRIVVTTLLMSLSVVLLLGFVVIGQVRNGLLDAKVKASQSQATGGFTVAEQKADSEANAAGNDSTDPNGDRVQNVVEWMTTLVSSLSSGGQGAFDVVTLSPASADGETGGLGPRVSGDVQWDLSVPVELRERVDDGTSAVQSYTRIYYENGQESQPGLIIGKQVSDPNSHPYQLYYLFPLTQEEKSLSLVKGTLATAGLFVVVLLGAIAWLVVRQVVTPVRMAAGIAERLSAGRLQERMKVSGEDDIARLGEAFNKMAQNLQLKIQQLEDLSRMQRRFVSDVSHELRTPLTTVRMAADVIHDARVDFDPVTARSAELLADQLDRFESLLADLLEISRFDAGAAALEAEPIDLREVVRKVVSGAEPLAERKGTRIRVLGDQQPVVAEADARRVERVLRNLVVNAVEHGEGKDVVVKLAAAGGAVAVAVRDHGVGLKPGEATRVFSRFWRADPARARTTGGTGLGLSIALEDARLHGGWLQAWGEPGGGSQFRLTLPRTADEPLRGSPIPLEPKDSRRNRGLNEAGLPLGGGGKLATVPVQAGEHGGARAAIGPRPGAGQAPTADPTALPGNGARVVPRPATPPASPSSAVPARRTEDGEGREGPAEKRPAGSDAERRHEQGEAFRGR
ncbi:MtrAB system histidine kinase MtrB [Streptomyces caniscabiei]|uniref:Sensor histidine kinase MtrB n=1 Tax=Streptomyces caniscabiei TaxID=2746961 RepID=A0A927QQR1_9ACTN|nr:MtrAB system histidine kinase MtrB [Streptomyces caniscabiei]MBD9704706.1 HAMP domain-containing protein [Streptomyces caniscabiei]MBD9728864.1 HAMP domain-containing protein [Streptomyces caniscabiei]MDX3513991.1 MtrAB system histidine kinase MtrB [Streptomyces caniscabiei]MDX3723413.1 MtrAB system histidine kinase MtrB [Streptomyces caniscabiei]MDX3733801.1 MtrAB system histidine kinase MtrB [Streptomyces caniscabiei]